MDSVSIRAFVYQSIITLLVVCVLCTAMVWSLYEINWFTIDGGGERNKQWQTIRTYGWIDQLQKNPKNK
ncbi:MAG: hypothetical protein ACETVZ_08555 [Phycisphaerae bacterium]